VKWGLWSKEIYENGKRFFEQVERGTFADSLKDKNQYAFYSHDFTKRLACVDDGSLVLEEDAIGLKYMIIIPNTRTGKTVMREMDKGELNKVSIGFRYSESNWTWKDKRNYRTVLKAELLEISLVKNPAYDDTSVMNGDRRTVLPIMESINRMLEMSEALQRKAMLQKIDGILKKYN
jgi:HK97 family phage prohead protease